MTAFITFCVFDVEKVDNSTGSEATLLFVHKLPTFVTQPQLIMTTVSLLRSDRFRKSRGFRKISVSKLSGGKLCEGLPHVHQCYDCPKESTIYCRTSRTPSNHYRNLSKLSKGLERHKRNYATRFSGLGYLRYVTNCWNRQVFLATAPYLFVGVVPRLTATYYTRMACTYWYSKCQNTKNNKNIMN